MPTPFETPIHVTRPYLPPIGTHGDLSMFSFHATKLYHSVEGGMLTFANPEYKETFNYLKNFGFENEVEVVMPGTNAKVMFITPGADALNALIQTLSFTFFVLECMI